MAWRTKFGTLAAWLALCAGQVAYAAVTVYQDPAEFLAENVPGCSQQVLWLKKELKAEVEELLERPFSGIRVRYCLQGQKTAWILDEIGKTEPITSGIIVDKGKVERVRVLVFRESRGSEVHRSAFTRQYENASLENDHALDRHIDGITGATLSVWALNRQVKLALLLDGAVQEKLRDG
jgi:hypothetical protein